METTSSQDKVSGTVSKRHVSYHWQLFVPLTLAMWTLLLVMGLWQRHNMSVLNDARVREPLEFVCKRVIDAFESNTDPLPFINFMANYYKENPLYESVCMSVYQNGKLIYNTGEIIEPYLSDNDKEALLEAAHDKETNFFYKALRSEDGSVEVYSMMPYSYEVSAVLDERVREFWWAMLLITVIVTVIGYFSTRHFGRNIRMLRTFAEKAATNPNFVPSTDYPHDELGDISRQIVHIYNDRLLALQRLKQEHEVAMHAMEEKARVKRQMTNNINHELKTPIGVIKGYIDTIVANPDMDEDARRHFLRKAQEHSDRLVQLVADVTAITRLQEGSGMINLEELDYHDVVYNCANDAAESGILASMTFNNDVPPGCSVKGNYNLLLSMLMNLLRNAVAYSRGTMCGVRLLGEDEKYYFFEFYDNGVGVPEEHLEHLFERFYRVDSGRSRKAGGTGLGLPIVESTVEAHGGHIRVYNSKNNGGLCFSYCLLKTRLKDE